MSDPTGVKADLIPYSTEYRRDVHSWLDSPETLRAVCRGKEFPPPEDVVDGWHRKGVAPFIMLSANKPVAYGELWNRPLELALEVSHLLVAPAYRGKGYGTKMLELLVARAETRRDIAKVMINLFDDDEVALGCYLKAGFEVLGMSKFTTGIRLVKLIK